MELGALGFVVYRGEVRYFVSCELGVLAFWFVVCRFSCFLWCGEQGNFMS